MFDMAKATELAAPQSDLLVLKLLRDAAQCTDAVETSIGPAGIETIPQAVHDPQAAQPQSDLLVLKHVLGTGLGSRLFGPQSDLLVLKPSIAPLSRSPHDSPQSDLLVLKGVDSLSMNSLLTDLNRTFWC